MGRPAVPPGEFIPLAEESGLIIAIGHWVLEQACMQLKRWQSDPATQHLKLAINVSAREFLQSDFLPGVQRAIREQGINPALLQLEITESLVLNVEDAIARMNALRQSGITFAMDDFGTGYSSLSRLSKLPLDQLKIDQSFVHDMQGSARDAAIVRTIIAMGHALGLEVLAEGVETSAQQVFLAELGCDVYQGYWCSPAVDVHDFERLLEQHFH